MAQSMEEMFEMNIFSFRDFTEAPNCEKESQGVLGVVEKF
jgi:hypothetical protein